MSPRMPYRARVFVARIIERSNPRAVARMSAVVMPGSVKIEKIPVSERIYLYVPYVSLGRKFANTMLSARTESRVVT